MPYSPPERRTNLGYAGAPLPCHPAFDGGRMKASASGIPGTRKF